MRCLDIAADDPVALEIGGFGAGALRYAGLGYEVVPLERGGKKPHYMLPETGGVRWASHDPATLRTWWRTDPAANIGIATGRMSQLAVIDCDVKGSANGIKSFWDFAVSQGLFAEPLNGLCVAETPSGGAHLWFRVTGRSIPIPERPGILPGVDVKGDGGLVVAPPSMKLVSAGGREVKQEGQVPVGYRWVTGCPCDAPYAPPALLDWIRNAPGGFAEGGGTGEGDTPDEAEAIARGFERGSRNAQLYRLACAMYRRYGLSQAGLDETWRKLHAAWAAGDRTGFGESELRRVAQSARQFVETAVARDEELIRASQSWRERYT